jgi:hypothetical protein
MQAKLFNSEEVRQSQMYRFKKFFIDEIEQVLKKAS